MCFNVSKIRFLINELFTILLIPTLFTMTLVILNCNISISVILWLWAILYFFLKIDLYSRDKLYINEGYVKLNRIKTLGASDLVEDHEIIEKEYVAETLYNFKERPTKFILYGSGHIETKNYIVTLKSKSLQYENAKNIKKIVIRKNFKDIKKIRKLLNSAINVNKI